MQLTSFYSALSGLNAHALDISVIGNNLSNVNTPGFKGSRANFRDQISVMLGSMAGSPSQVGLGVAPAGIQMLFTQSAMQTTSNATDLAIQGNGLFVLGGTPLDSNGATTGLVYSRAGNFTLDRQGNLVNPEGLPVMGFTTVTPGTPPTINTNTPVQQIRVPIGQSLAPRATALAQINTNLNANAAVGSTFNTSMQVFDTLGASHVLTYTFTRRAGATPSFGFDVTIDGGEVAGGTAGAPFSLLTGAPAAAPPPGIMNFDSNGRLASIAGVPSIGPNNLNIQFPPVNLTFTNGASLAAGRITWNIDNLPGQPLTNPLKTFNITSFAGPSATVTTTQDGFGSGTLSAISISGQGVVLGTFSNGQVNPLAQVALANFANPGGLIKAGSNAYLASLSTSGEAVTGTAGTGGRGTIVSSALELSSVDIAQEFTHLITAQRGYQANSKVITTSDEIIAQTVNLIR